MFAKLILLLAVGNCDDSERVILSGLLLAMPIHSLHNSSYVQKFLPTGFLRLFDVSLFAFFRAIFPTPFVVMVRLPVHLKVNRAVVTHPPNKRTAGKRTGCALREDLSHGWRFFPPRRDAPRRVVGCLRMLDLRSRVHKATAMSRRGGK